MGLFRAPIIFFGFGRSGTTIISEIVSRHPELAWISNYQNKFPGSPRINILRRGFDNCFWQIWGQKRQRNRVPLFNKYFFKPAEAYGFWNYLTGRDFAKSYLWKVREEEGKRKEIRSFFHDMVRYQGRDRLVFKITGPARLGYLHSLFPNARFIRITRKPLPNLRSLLNVDFYQNGKNDVWWKRSGVFSDHEMQMIKKWRNKEPALLATLQFYKVNEIYHKEKEQLELEGHVIEISYEDFVRNPENTVMKILDFADLSPCSSVRKYLGNIKIYNRNKKEDYYISAVLDDRVYKIATEGTG